MKCTTLGLLAIAGGLLASATPAQAQFWQPINQRQRNLDARIDAGVRSGDLTRMEANRLRIEFRNIANLEGRYRRTGGRLTLSERTDLDRRFDTLNRRVYAQRHDRQERRRSPWQSINQRQRNLDTRIDAGVRRGDLTWAEAVRLRSEFRMLAGLEARYRRSGGQLTLRERSDLDRRFDGLSRRIRAERADRQNW